MLSIEVTTKCNLKCLNCFAHDSGDKLSDMDYHQAVNILNEGIDLGYKELSLTGGEPFLWDKIFDLLKYAKNIGYTYILINSNGHLFTDQLCKNLSVFSDILNITLTINGTKEEHNLVRGKGSYAKAITGLTNALKYNLNISVYCVVTKGNIDYIPYFVKELFETHPKIKSIIFIQLRGKDDNYYNAEDIKLKPEDFIQLVKTVGLLALAGYNVSILENSLSTVVAKKLNFKWLSESPEISRYGKIVILQNQELTLNHSSNLRFGKYYPGALKEILSSKIYITQTRDESLECSCCEFIKPCREHGKLRPSEDEHNVGNKSKFYCQKVLELV